MTSCSDVVPSIIWQRPGISSGGLWERNKPFNYSSEGLFENMLALFPSTCAFFLSVASLCRWRVRSCKMLLFNLPCKRGHDRWQSRAVAESIATLNAVSWGSRLEITAPWSASRRMVWVYPICSCAKFISLIYAAAERRLEWPAWLSTEARKKRSGGNHHSTGSHREEWHLKLLQHFCSKRLIPDWHIINRIPYFYRGKQNL